MLCISAQTHDLLLYADHNNVSSMVLENIF